MNNFILRIWSVLRRFLQCFTVVISLSVLFIPSGSYAKGGIALGATRVIYPQGAKQTSLSIINSSTTSRYLVQSWIEDNNGNKSSDFIVTPPLFLSKVKSENALRIMYIGKPLPSDRESIFWINSKAIPEIDSDNIEGKNVLQMAILSRIKLFVRPDNLPLAAPDALRFQQQGAHLKIKNPTPYYITLVELTVAGKKLPNIMVPPLQTTECPLPTEAKGIIFFRTINDYGAQTPSQKGVEG